VESVQLNEGGQSPEGQGQHEDHSDNCNHQLNHFSHQLQEERFEKLVLVPVVI
jgi:hypothetical protein